MDALYEWDRNAQAPRKSPVTIDKSKVEKVVLRYWNKGDAKIEGCVVKMKDGYSPSEYGLACTPAEARRALGLIEAMPAGTPATRTN